MKSENRDALITLGHLQKADHAAQVAQDVLKGNGSPAQAMASAFAAWQSLRTAIELLVIESVRAGELTYEQVDDALGNLHGVPPADQAASENS
jgi:hypothetical protein